jgi:hypothetical protein
MNIKYKKLKIYRIFAKLLKVLTMKKITYLLNLLLFVLFICGSNYYTAQVSVTATAGTAGPTTYVTVSAAFTAINAGTHQGAITIEITANTTEPGSPTALLQSATPSSYSSILIRPSGGNFTIGGTVTASRAIIELRGADNVTIDGDDPNTAGNRNLTIGFANTAATAAACIRVSSNSTLGADGASNNIIRNCIITGNRVSGGTTATYGINMSNYSTASLTTGGYSSLNNLFENNLITRCYHGIWAVGASTTYNNVGTIIRNNVLGDGTTAGNIGNRGVLISYSSNAVSQTPALIVGNDIQVGDPGTTGYAATIAGIEVGTVNFGIQIVGNNIHDIYQPSTGGYGAYGITITGSATTSDLIIRNNFIHRIAASNFTTTSISSFTNYGVRISAGATNIAFDHNTVRLNVANATGTTLNPVSYCVAATVNGVTFSSFRNNILNNTNNSTNAMCFYTNATGNISAGLVDNNSYFSSNGTIGYYNATVQTTFSDWKTATSKDVNSNNINPPFVSSTNPHLDVAGAGIISFYQTGATGTGVSNDFDGEPRTVNPCIGADEFVLPVCQGTPAFASSSISPSTAVCGNGNFAMSVVPVTASSGYTFGWQKSSDNINWTSIPNATGSNYSEANVTATTYYQCILTCSASGQSVTSSVLTATINPLPTITITPSNNGYFCGAAGQTLTASGAATYAWTPSASLDAATGTTVTSSVSTPTTYTVTGTDANGCVNTQQITVGPPSIAINASTPSFCGTGGNTTLTATSVVDPDLSYTWTSLTPSATLSTNNGSTTIATLTETSDFKVTGTGSGSFTGCTSEAFVSIGVYPLPSATVTTTANGVCPGTAATINSGLSAGNFTVSSIAHTNFVAPNSAGVLMNNGVATTPLSGGDLDDGGWGSIPIGFSFNFFGTSFTTLAAGTNGLLMFGNVPGYGTGAGQLGQFNFSQNASTCNPAGAATGQYFPNCNNPGNIIALLAADMQMANSVNGSIKYWNEGYSPNRKFIIQYKRVHGWSNNPEATVTCVLYETLGIVDIFIDNKTFSNSAIVGLQDATKTIGAVAPGRAGTWTVNTPEAWRFAPPSNYATTWTATDANGTTTIATGNNIFSQSVSPAITTTYAISYTNQTTGCTNAPGSAQVLMSILGNTAPNEVVALTNTPTVCSGGAVSLSTDYLGSQDGLTFQWQVSTDNGISFSNIPNANAITYTGGTQTQTSIYQLQITACGGTPSFSTPVTVGMTPYQDCYCIPTSNCGSGDVIGSISLNTLNNVTGTTCGVGGYSNYTTDANLTTTLLPSTTYTCVVGAASFAQSIAIWIDYNDDGIFDNNTERIGYTTTPVPVNGTASFNVVLGCTPPVGPHRMRVRSSDDSFVTGVNQTPCATYSWGETEDYLITIAPVPTCPAPGQLSVVTTTNSTADLSWNLGCSSASNFDFEYGPVGFTQGTGTLVSNVAATVNAGVGTYTLTGLTPNSTYAIYYRANCGNGDVSPWSVATNGATICNPITLNNPGNQTVCDSYTLPAITEATPSGNAGLVLEYRTQPSGGGNVITSSTITSSQTVYIYASAGNCTAEQNFTVTVNTTPLIAGGASNATLCLGDSTNFSLTAGQAATFTFVENGNVIGTSTYPISFYVTPSSSTNIGVYSTANGCSSDTLNIALTVNLPSSSNETQTACDSYQWNGQTYTSSGVYTYTTQNAVGCDSVVTLNLTINNSSSFTDVHTACDLFTWIDGITYTSSTNNPTFTLTNAAGCDSVITLNLTINYSNTGTDVQVACDSFTWIDGVTYTSSTNTPTFTLTNATGCDSTVTLNLTINNSSTGTDVQVACQTFTWIDGITYTSSTNTPTFTLTNAVGCDSVVTLNLTINDNIADVTTISACSSYQWNGQTYTQSGTYTYTGSGSCSVTDTLNLTILNNTGTDTQVACDSYTWIDGITYTSSTNTPTFTLTNAAGCDSLVTLNLTINNATSSTSQASACGSYTWNGQTYTQSGTYTFTTSNANGCDSVATLNLTINSIPNAVATGSGATLTSSTGSSYQWIDCGSNSPIQGATAQTYTALENGSYAVIVTNAAGCSDTSNCVVVDQIGLVEISKIDVNVNPNPSSGIFNIDFNSPINCTLNVLDASGRVVYSSEISDDTTIDLSFAMTGIYYLEVSNNEFKKIIRVVKN